MMTVCSDHLPVHTGLSVLIGIVFVALARRNMLITRQIMNPAPHSHQAVPETSFILPRQNAKPASKQPAIISIAQLQFTCITRIVHILPKTAANILVINEIAIVE